MIHWSVWLIPWSHFICKVNENLERSLRTVQRCCVWCNRSHVNCPCLEIPSKISSHRRNVWWSRWWSWRWWSWHHGDADDEVMIMVIMMVGVVEEARITDNNIFHCTHLKLSLVTFYDPLHTISNPDALWSAVLWPFVTCIFILM